MGGAAPALMELWKKQTSAAVPQVEQLRAGNGASRRSSVRGVRLFELEVRQYLSLTRNSYSNTGTRFE